MILETKTFPLFTHNKKKNFFFRGERAKRFRIIFLIVFPIISGWNFSNVSTVDAALKSCCLKQTITARLLKQQTKTFPLESETNFHCREYSPTTQTRSKKLYPWKLIKNQYISSQLWVNFKDWETNWKFLNLFSECRSSMLESI